jgi:hypothetical protein
VSFGGHGAPHRSRAHAVVSANLVLGWLDGATYQVVGDGGLDLLFVPTATSPIDLRARHGRISRHPYRGYRLLMVMESVGGMRVKNGGIHL